MSLDLTLDALFRALAGAPDPGWDLPGLEVHRATARGLGPLLADDVYPQTRAAVLARQGLPGWQRLLDRWLARCPPTHPVPDDDAQSLPGFLAEDGAALGLPAWLVGLADLEACTRAVQRDEAPDPGADGPIQLHPTAILRVYPADLLGWLDGDDPAQDPAPGEHPVLLWRDAEDAAARMALDPEVYDLIRGLARGAVPHTEDARALLAELVAVGAACGACEQSL